MSDARGKNDVPILLWDHDDVASALRVPRDTIVNLHRTHQLRGIQVGKHLRWKPDDVRAFVENLGGDNGHDHKGAI